MTAILVAGFVTAPAAATTLQVGIKESLPFTMRDHVRVRTGVGVELWRLLADQQNLKFELVERDPGGLVAGLADGSLDVVVSPLTVERQDYAFGLEAHSTLREELNRGLLGVLADGTWARILRRYLGEQVVSGDAGKKKGRQRVMRCRPSVP
jgi:ABC-type amino acid transport substrate-binding protein